MAPDPVDKKASPFLARKARRRVHAPPGPDTGYAERVRAYYLETWYDYRGLWMNPDNRSIHFGYWDDDTTSHAEALQHMNRAIARSLGIRPGDRVLDAGCGVGGSAIWLAKELGAHVVGIN